MARQSVAIRNQQEPALDDIFFHKSQIAVGTTLRYVGRLDPGSLWDVTSITSHTWRGGSAHPTVVPGVQYLSDTLHLRRRGNGDAHAATFVYLSYSAIWRIAHGVPRARPRLVHSA